MANSAAVCEDTVATRRGSHHLHLLARWLRASLPVLLWTGYLLAGAAVFHAVEGPSAARHLELQANLTQETNRTIVALFEKLLNNMNDTVNSTGVMAELAHQLQLMANDSNKISVKWNFMNSALFCMTVVSTIGYGVLSPKTQLGRGICIIYALIGIPLNIIVMASAGKALTRGIRAAQRCLGRCKKHALTGLALWKTRVGPQTDISSGTAATSPKVLELEGGMKSVAFLRSLSPISEVDWNNWDTSNAESPAGAAAGAHPREADAVTNHTRDDRTTTAAVAASVDNGDHDTRDGDQDQDVSSCAFVLLVLAYTCVFALAMYVSERDWTVLDSFYYIIITITTIGFGDLVTGSALSEDTGYPGYVFLSCLAIAIPVIGMIILSAGIGIVVNQCGKKTRAIERLICGSSEARG